MQDVTPGGGQWHGPAPWHGRSGRHDDVPDWAFGVRQRRRRHHGNGEPLRRDPDDRLLGAVAALISTGWAVPFYVLGWLLIPVKGEQTSIVSKARHDARGVVLAIALAS